MKKLIAILIIGMFILSAGAVYAADGTQKWRFNTGNAIDSSPAIGADGTIYVGSWDCYLYAVNPNGTQKWKFPTSGVIYSSPAIGADGTIYVGSGDSYLYAIEGSSGWTTADYRQSMKAYANSNWSRFGQNNFNLHRAVPTLHKSLPIDRFLKILNENRCKNHPGAEGCEVN